MKREFFIAGVQFRPQTEIRATASVLKAGHVLLLEPEPTNRFDPNAVKIIYPEEQIFLGYVPKKFSSEVSGLLEGGIDLECIVKTVDPKAKTYEMFSVVVKEVSEIEEVINEFGTVEEIEGLNDEDNDYETESDVRG
jgi:hypothetical protein